MTTVNGTPDDDGLKGSSDSDLIYGGEGNDTIEAGLGNDTIHGDGGDDELYGGTGADTIFGGSGNDLIYGGGPDTPGDTVWLNTSTGDLIKVDIVNGTGTSTLVGNSGITFGDIGMGPDGKLYGVAFNGTSTIYEINTTTGAATEIGPLSTTGTFQFGNALSFDENGTAYAGSASTSHILAFDPANPAGASTWWTNPNGGNSAGDVVFFPDHAFVAWNGGGGTQLIRVELDDDNNPVSFEVLGLLPSGTYGMTVGADGTLYVATPASGVQIVTVPTAPVGGGSGILGVTPVPGATGLGGGQIYGATSTAEAHVGGVDSADYIDAGEGNDTVYGMGGDDTILGGDGDDQIYGGDDNDSIEGGTGTDEIYGDAGDDVISGGHGNDILYGGDGNDTISGDAGADLIYGGLGDDSLAGNDGNDAIYGGDGNDTIDAGGGDDSVYAGLGDDLVSGGDGNDTMHGKAGDDTISGDGGDDQLFGGEGDDQLKGGDGNDSLQGDDGNDQLYGDDGDDTLLGGQGDDKLYGGEGADQLFGGSGNNTLYGGDGNDTINVDTGTGLVYGGDGSDTIYLTGSPGYGTVIDGNEDADDSDLDVLDLTGITVPFRVVPDADDPIAGTKSEDGWIEFLDTDGNVIGTIRYVNIETIVMPIVPCFTPGTRIRTPNGEVPVEELSAGDEVITLDGTAHPLVWTGRRDMTRAEVAGRRDIAPVRILRGALGDGLPLRDMTVSPQHRFLLKGPKVELLFGESEVLVPAVQLVGMPGISRVTPQAVSYIHIMFQDHQIVCSDGIWTESFQPGRQSVSSMDEAQRSEILNLFPMLADNNWADYPASCRTLHGHEARVLLAGGTTSISRLFAPA